MGTLYIVQDDAFIGKVDERIHVKFERKILQDVPFIHVEGVVILGRAT
ncbi:MAG: CRISPR-associated endonuclease Cas1, partial [Aphanizomenon sp.]